MRKKINPLMIPVFIIGILFILSDGCKKDIDDPLCPCRTRAVFNPQKVYGTVTDIDGNQYKTIVIGAQTWMAENLRTTHYRNGDPIPENTDAKKWMKLTAGAFCSYDNTKDADTLVAFGRLYNWFAATDSRNIAPAGWHLPSDSEWTILIEYLGGDSIAGGKLKETGVNHWITPNAGANNSSGFTAIPGGCQLSDNSIAILQDALYWSSSEYDSDNAIYRTMHYFSRFAYRMHFLKEYGLSIRCIKDN
jgi:uncharacterized protein (TIGR02145 family)